MCLFFTETCYFKFLKVYKYNTDTNADWKTIQTKEKVSREVKGAKHGDISGLILPFQEKREVLFNDIFL